MISSIATGISVGYAMLARSSARRRGRSAVGWGVATFLFVPSFLLLICLGSKSAYRSDNEEMTVLEGIASCLIVLAFLAIIGLAVLIVLHARTSS